MGSKSSSEVNDNRLVVDQPASQFTGPQSVLANPLGQAIHLEGKKQSVHQEFGDLTYNEFPEEANILVGNILNDNQETLRTVTDAVTGLSTDMNETASEFVGGLVDMSDGVIGSLSGMLEGIKTPLAKYMPYALLASGLFVLYKLRK